MAEISELNEAKCFIDTLIFLPFSVKSVMVTCTTVQVVSKRIPVKYETNTQKDGSEMKIDTDKNHIEIRKLTFPHNFYNYGNIVHFIIPYMYERN